MTNAHVWDTTTNPPTYTGPRPGRPPLNRYRADIVLTVELGATDQLDAIARVAALTDRLAPRLAATVRNTRTGAPELVVLADLGNAHAADTAAALAQEPTP